MYLKFWCFNENIFKKNIPHNKKIPSNIKFLYDYNINIIQLNCFKMKLTNLYSINYNINNYNELKNRLD